MRIKHLGMKRRRCGGWRRAPVCHTDASSNIVRMLGIMLCPAPEYAVALSAGNLVCCRAAGDIGGERRANQVMGRRRH